MKRERIILACIVLLALAIRLYPVRANLPYMYWHDENNYIENALRFGTGNFSMTTFSHGGLFQIVLFAEYAVSFAIVMLLGLVRSSSDFLAAYLRDPSGFFILARCTTAACGTGIVILLYAIARRTFGGTAALLAALFGALAVFRVCG